MQLDQVLQTRTQWIAPLKIAALAESKINNITNMSLEGVLAYMNQSCIADVDRYDTGALKCNCHALIQFSPALRNWCMLDFAVTSYLLVELHGEVTIVCGIC
jgi:hypothetical protein